MNARKAKRKHWKTILAVTLALIVLPIAISSSRILNPLSPPLPTVFPKPMTGFQYPLDSGGGYHVNWDNFNISTIRYELHLMKNYFPDTNVIRCPIDWNNMTSTTVDKMKQLLDVADDYGFNVAFVLFNRLDFSYLTIANYEGHKNRIDTIVGPLKDDKRVAYWAIGNEKILHHSSVLRWMKEMVDHIKTVDTDTPITTSLDPSYIPDRTEGVTFLNEINVDVIEYHVYPSANEDIAFLIDSIVSLSKKPVIISEFSVDNGSKSGLKSYTFDIRKTILNGLLSEASRVSSIIGVLYYRFSLDNDNFTIIDNSTEKPKPEYDVLNTWFPYFMAERPFITSTYSLQEDIVNVSNPSFEEHYSNGTAMNWSNSSEDVTSYSAKVVESSNRHVGSFQPSNDLKNPDFELGGANDTWGEWPYDWHWWTEKNYTWPDWALEWDNGTFLSGSRSVNITSHLEYADIIVYQEFNVSSCKVYRFTAYVYTELEHGANASIQIVFKNSSGSWISYPNSIFLRGYNNWTEVFVMGVAPVNTVSVQLNLKLKGKGCALFDNTSLVEMEATSFDDDNKALAMVVTNGSRGYCMAYQTLPIQQGMIYHLEAYGGTVSSTSSPPDTVWNGSVAQIAFLDSNNETLTWLDAKWLSGYNNWTKLTISGIPPPGAEKIEIVFKINFYEWAVFFVDHVTLKQSPIIYQKSHSFLCDNHLYTTISSLTETISVTNIYCGEYGKPQAVFVNGEKKNESDVWNYSSRVLTITCLVTDNTNIVVDFNQKPMAVLAVSKTCPKVNKTITFNGTASYDPDGEVVYYFFDFGDGTNSSWTTLSVVEHSYAREGTYNATLTVMDDFGATSRPSCCSLVPITVIPEFPATLMIPFFMILTLIVVIMARTVKQSP